MHFILLLLALLCRLFEKKNEIDDLIKQFELGNNCVPVTCAEVECVFEFVGYSFCGRSEEPWSREVAQALSRSIKSETQGSSTNNRNRQLPKKTPNATSNHIQHSQSKEKSPLPQSPITAV